MSRPSGVDNIKAMLDKYSSSSADFFVLKEDDETARVRFLHKDDKDLDIIIVHKVVIGGKEKYVECTMEHTGKCAFCEAGMSPMVRGFFQLVDFRDKKRKLWDRGKTEITQILGLIGRYGTIDDRDFDIQRHGKKGDKETKYQFFSIDKEDSVTDKFEERVEILGEDKFVLQKTYEEMKDMVNQGVKPPENRYGAKAQGQGTQKMF